jgi:hypothetical protein
VDDAFVLQEREAGQELSSETADQREGEADEVVGADELVEVDGEAGRDDAEMGAKVEGGSDAEGGVRTIRILVSNQSVRYGRVKQKW